MLRVFLPFPEGAFSYLLDVVGDPEAELHSSDQDRAEVQADPACWFRNEDEVDGENSRDDKSHLQKPVIIFLHIAHVGIVCMV